MATKTVVTVEFLGIPVQAKFKKTGRDYVSLISRGVADDCYERALSRLNRSSFDAGFRLEVSTGSTYLGLVRSVVLFRYVHDRECESVQYIMSLRISEKLCELSVSHSVYSLFVELPESNHLSLFGD
jgi:hypothetical protein